jgi:PAS domain S-box-containing protein
MIWQETPYTIPFIGVSVLSFILGGYIWCRYRSPLGRTGSITILSSTGWIFTSVLSMAGGDLPTKIFWAKMQYPGIVVLPVAWFIFAVLYTGREKWLTRRALMGLTVIPGITLVLALTNEYHGLIWSSMVMNTTGPFTILQETYGIWLWAFIAYAYVLLLSGIVLFVYQIITCSRSLYRQQTSFLLVGAAIPWVASALASFGLNPFPHLDLTLVALTATNLVVAFNIFHFRLGDVVPLAREIVMESMNDSVIILDTKNNIVDANLSARQLMGTTTSCIGHPIKEVWPEWSSKELTDFTEGGKEIVLHNGQRIYDVNVSPLADWLGRTISRVVVLRDVTDRKRSEKIKQSLKEKEILLQEIHHRVKNNIQVISSLLSLQSRFVKDDTYVEMLREAQNRIRSMALIHEKLYQAENLASINFNEYITDLVNSLFRSYGVDTQHITFNIEVEHVDLGIDAAIPCGLIINELVSNALKYAFPDGKGEVTVKMRSVDGTVQMTVSDDGVGMPETVDFTTTESLGLHLVAMLAEDQLGGKVVLDRNTGTAFHITFTGVK